MSIDLLVIKVIMVFRAENGQHKDCIKLKTACKVTLGDDF